MKLVFIEFKGVGQTSLIHGFRALEYQIAEGEVKRTASKIITQSKTCPFAEISEFFVDAPLVEIPASEAQAA